MANFTFFGGSNGIWTHVAGLTILSPRPDWTMELYGRRDRIWTYNLMLPKHEFYQIEIHADGGESWSWTSTVVRRQIYSLLSSPLAQPPLIFHS